MPSLFSLPPGAPNLPQDIAAWFGRSDTPDGRAWGANGPLTPPPEVTQHLLQMLSAGLLQPNGPQGEQFARSLGYSPAGPTDPNYVQNQQAAGRSMTDIAFGDVPGTPANTQPTLAMRQLLLQAQQADAQAKIAQQNADLAAQLGKSADALAWKKQADDLATRTRELDQQASQFSQTYGLQAQEQAFRQQFDYSKYASELASKPQNLIQSALFQGSRMPGGMQPNATAFGGNANTPLGQQALGAPGQAGQAGYQPTGGYMDQQVPVPATVNALLTGQRVPKVGMTNAQGYMTTLGGLQGNRLNYSNMNAVSLRNVLANPEDAANLSSVLGAQGQTVDPYANSLNQSLPKRTADVTMGY